MPGAGLLVTVAVRAAAFELLAVFAVNTDSLPSALPASCRASVSAVNSAMPACSDCSCFVRLLSKSRGRALMAMS